MAIFHSSLQVISRGQGKSCMAAAAYRAGEKLYDERQNLNHDYTKKQNVESEIIAPSNSPSWVNDREKLWNEVDKSETRCNSRTAREINIALPLELSKEQQKELSREYVKENFVDKGMVADVCFHFNDESNPHFHVMLTTREITKEGFAKKNREWDKKENATIWREQWANNVNKALERAGYEDRIDHRSYKDQGIDQVPTIHLGKTSSEMEKKNIDNQRTEINKQIKELNKEKIIVLQEYRELKDKLEKEKINGSQKYSNLKPEEKAAVQKVEKLLNEPQTY
ncbi:MobQ family relaxase, partial [Clostridium sp.]|uniref:MobQ family relaxase n=1 Tax=Clostridium sp. TaxID=1506 RepID=UPI001A51572D